MRASYRKLTTTALCTCVLALSLSITPLASVVNAQTQASVEEARPFAGITQMVAKPSMGHLQRIAVTADLPFEYEVQPINANQVLVTFHRAHLASSLLTDSVVNIEPNGHVDKAVIQASSNPDNIQMILVGEGLGNKQILMEGGILVSAETDANSMSSIAPAEVTPQTSGRIATDLDDVSTETVELKPLAKPEAKQKIAVASEPLPVAKEKKFGNDAYLMLDYEQPQVNGIQPMKIRNKWEPLRVTTTNFAQPSNPDVELTVMPVKPVQETEPKRSEEPVNVLMQDDAGKKKAPLNTSSRIEIDPSEEAVAAPAVAVQAPKFMAPSKIQITEAKDVPRFSGITDKTAQPGDMIAQSGVRSDEVYKGPTITALPAYPYTPPNKNIVTAEKPMTYQVGDPGKTPTEPVNVLSYADVSSKQVTALMQQALTEFKKRDFSAAEVKIRQALAQNDQDPNIYAALGEIQVKTHRLQDAQKSYAQANSLDSHYSLRYAEVLVLNHQRPEAIMVLENLLGSPIQSLDKNHLGKIHYMLGTLNEEIGDTPKALDHLQTAERFNPNSADIQYNLGVAYELLGNPEKAKIHYANASRLNPTASDAKLALSRVSSQVN